MDSPVSTTSTSSSKGRRGNAAGGGKAWNEDEMRLQKVAYKKIAAHLNKTELACRLHYHQLSHGGNRRKRKSSPSSSESNSNSPKSSTSMDISKITNQKQSDSNPLSVSSLTSPFSTPLKIPTSAPSKDIMGALQPAIDLPGPASSKEHAHKKAKLLRVDCSPDGIDEAKLRNLVDRYSSQLWVAVAQEYGSGVTPDYLERYWKSRQDDRTPPTPIVSPKSVKGERPAKKVELEKKSSETSKTTESSAPDVPMKTPSQAKAPVVEPASPKAPVTAEATPVAEEKPTDQVAEKQVEAILPAETPTDVAMKDVV